MGKYLNKVLIIILLSIIIFNVFKIFINYNYKDSTKYAIMIDDELNKLNNQTLDNYELVLAEVIKNNDGTITINKGKNDGIKNNMIAINTISLIGKITNVKDNESTISLLTSNNDTIKVAVDIDNMYHGILSGYDGKYFIINSVERNSDISTNSLVYTNGLGKLYPSGIYIGKVVDIKDDDFELSKVLRVKPELDYNNIKYVNIIK